MHAGRDYLRSDPREGVALEQRCEGDTVSAKEILYLRGRSCICEGDTVSARGYCICEGDTVSEVKQEREVLSAGIRGMRRKETVRSDRLVREKDE